MKCEFPCFLIASVPFHCCFRFRFLDLDGTAIVRKTTEQFRTLKYLGMIIWENVAHFIFHFNVTLKSLKKEFNTIY